MSTETENPQKKSILTVAMERVQAEKTKKKLDADAEQIIADIDSRKKSIRNMILGGVLAVSTVYTVVKLVKSTQFEDETSDEETVTED